MNEPATTSDAESKANLANHITMTRLEYEFEMILISLTIGTNTTSTCSSSFTDSTSGYEDYNYAEFSTKYKDAISHLRSIAERMNSIGNLSKCIEVYMKIQKLLPNVTLERLSIHKLSVNDIHKLEWEELEVKIRRWKQAAKSCAKIRFVSEKRLCDQIFEGLGTAIDGTCFMEIVRDIVLSLFDSLEAISIGVRGQSKPEKLFELVDLHNTVSDLLPDIDLVLELKYFESIEIHAVQLLSQLAEAARESLSEFKNDLLHEQSNYVDLKVDTHPLAIYVVNYIIQISCYKGTLTKLITSKQENGRNSIQSIIAAKY